jgi:hypothetical protein
MKTSREPVNDMGQQLHPTIVAAPGLSFTQIRELMTGAGWTLESQSEKPMLPSEPEFAVFVSPDMQTNLHYTFNPVVRLRALQVRGAEAASRREQIAKVLPNLQEAGVRSLLASADLRERLLGLFAAEELGLIGLTNAVLKLQSDADSRVSQTAARVSKALLNQAFIAASAQIAQEATAHPGRSAWFQHLASTELRKQTLRWLMRDCKESNESIDQTLRSALSDPDPEVRITAVIAAAKLNAKNVGHALRAAVIPTSTSEGSDPRDRFFCERLRQTALRYLATESAAANDTSNAGKREQFRKAVCGELEVRDDPTLLMHALITPLEPAEPPVRLPEGVEPRDGRYFLKRSGLELRWVAPIPHWLGEDATGSPAPQNPIHRITPNNGFFTAEMPLTTAMVFWSSEPDTGPPAAGGQNDASPFLCTYEVATHLCEVFSDLEGASLHLPSTDQWEMATRGPDGRRYPWGNCLCRNAQLSASTWGVRKATENVFEWTSDVGSAGSRIVCGGQPTAPCATRHVVAAGDASAQCSLRFVLEGESN